MVAVSDVCVCVWQRVFEGKLEEEYLERAIGVSSMPTLAFSVCLSLARSLARLLARSRAYTFSLARSRSLIHTHTCDLALALFFSLSLSLSGSIDRWMDA